MKSISILTLTSFAAFGICEGALRTTNTNNEKENFKLNPWEALLDWNHDLEPHLDHGRKLFSTFDECFSATNSAVLCSCVFLDNNDFEYCQACGGSLLAANFNLDDVTRFGEWFSDETVLNLAQTGTYVGIAGITEYVNFIYSVFFDSYELLEPFGIKFIPNDNFANDGQCIVTLAAHRRIALPSEFYDDECYRLMAGTTIYYVATTAENGYIDVVQANIFYPSIFLEAFFGNVKEDATIEWLCGTIETYCPSIWEANNFDNNVQKCMNNYKTLPRAEGDLAAIDGKSLGCKILHGTFVPLNPFHCAHTSFVKQKDPSGEIKCQKSEHVQPEDLFSETELDFFFDVGVEQFGFGATLTDTSQTRCS